MADVKYTDPQEVLRAIVSEAWGELAVLETKLKSTGEKVNVLVACREMEGGTALFPLAILFNQDPFDVLESPDGVSVRWNGGVL